MAMPLLLCIALDKYARFFVAFFGEKTSPRLASAGHAVSPRLFL